MPTTVQWFPGHPVDPAARLCRDGRMELGRAGRVSLVVVLVACLLAALSVLAFPLLIALLLSLPSGSTDGLRDEVGGQARDLAYALRDEHVRSALDRGEPTARIARLTGTVAPDPDRIRAIGDGGGVDAGRPVLLRAERVAASGSAIELAWGGTSGGGTEFGPPAKTWVTCIRVELPATTVAATAWSVRDIDCPAFAPSVRQSAERVHVAGFAVVPLLRPPCYGTTGYCPGG